MPLLMKAFICLIPANILQGRVQVFGSWAAWDNTYLLITLTPKGIVFCILFCNFSATIGCYLQVKYGLHHSNMPKLKPFLAE